MRGRIKDWLAHASDWALVPPADPSHSFWQRPESLQLTHIASRVRKVQRPTRLAEHHLCRRYSLSRIPVGTESGQTRSRPVLAVFAMPGPSCTLVPGQRRAAKQPRVRDGAVATQG